SRGFLGQARAGRADWADGRAARGRLRHADIGDWRNREPAARTRERPITERAASRKLARTTDDANTESPPRPCTTTTGARASLSIVAGTADDAGTAIASPNIGRNECSANVGR